jgi:hypothetical protein
LTSKYEERETQAAERSAMTREQSWGIKTTLDANVSPNHHRICWLPQGDQRIDQVMGSRDASRSFPAKEWVIIPDQA